MKCFLPLLSVLCFLGIAGPSAAAPVVETVHAFGSTPSTPGGDLVLAPDGWLWGTTEGTATTPAVAKIYRVRADGSDWQSVYSFTTADGSRPRGLALDGAGYAWGATLAGGTAGKGTIYKIHLGTRAFQVIANFSGIAGTTMGAECMASLTPDGAGHLWGTTASGGDANLGTVFKVNIASGAFTTVHHFGGSQPGYLGSRPKSSLLDDGAGFLWGTTEEGGTYNYGTVFKIAKTTGAVTTVIDFRATAGTANAGSPGAGLTADGAGFLWGIAKGTSIFKIHALTGAYTTMFTPSNSWDNPIGETPQERLTADGKGFFWGINGSTGSQGTLFKVEIATGAAVNVHRFDQDEPTKKGLFPSSRLCPDGRGGLWGATSGGGADSKGTVYRLDPSTGTVATMVEFTGYAARAGGYFPLGKLAVDPAGMLWGTASIGGMGQPAGTLFKFDPAAERLTTTHDFEYFSADDRPVTGVIADNSGNWWGSVYRKGIYRASGASGVALDIASFSSLGSSLSCSAEMTRDGAGNLWGITAWPSVLFRVNPQTATMVKMADYPTVMKSLVLDDAGTLWGISYDGGVTNGNGTIFRVNPATGAMITVIPFSDNGASNKGKNPETLVKGPDGHLWGTTTLGGAANKGTLFKFNPATNVLTTEVDFAATPGFQDFDELAFDAAGDLWGIMRVDDGKLVRRRASTGALSLVHHWGNLYMVFGGTTRIATLTPHPDGNLYGTAVRDGQENRGTLFRVRMGPSPVTLVASGVSVSGAVLNGTVNPNGTATTWWFERRTPGGTFTAPGNTPPQPLAAGGTVQAVSYPVSGLVPGQEYEFRLAATNAEALVTQYGEILRFKAGPALAITGPAGESLGDGSAIALGSAITGKRRDHVFTIRNDGNTPLTDLTVTVDGTHAGDFTLVVAPPVTLQPGQQASFTLGFNPPLTAARSAAVHVSATGVAESPVDIGVSGLGLSKTVDTDGDGLNDAAEFELTALGFDWQVSQPAKVATLLDGTFQMSLYTDSQIETLSPGNPVIRKNAATGKFEITLDWKRSPGLTGWQDFPLSPAAISVDPSGDLRLEVTGAGSTEFFLLEVE